jgi:ribonuclease HI
MMKFKKLTDKQLEYIICRVIGPQIEYLAQLTIFTEAESNKFSSPLRRLFKNQIRLAVSAPNYITDSSFLCKSLSLYDLQLQSHISKLHKQVNNSGLLGRISFLLARQLQSDYWLPSSPLSHWPFHYQRCFGSNLLASTLSLMYSHRFTFDDSNLPTCTISGGDFPLVDVMGNSYVKPSTLRTLKRTVLMFLSQLTTLNGQLLLKWADLTALTNTTITHREPKWFSHLEAIILHNRALSRRLKIHYCTPVKALPNPLHIPDMTRTRVQEWVVVYNQMSQSVIIGRIRNKSAYANSMIIEHWLHWIDNEAVSPSYLQTIIQPCPGCDLHNNNYGSIHLTRPLRCAALYPSTHPVSFTQSRKLGTNKYLLAPSLFYLQQLAKTHYERQSNPIFVPPVLPHPRVSQPLDAITSNILSIRKRTEIVSLRADFSHARLLEFYTDGSLRQLKTDSCTMGIGWVQSNTYGDTPMRTFSAQVQKFPSALRAETYAVLSALCTSPPLCIVKIFTDNMNVVNGLNHIITNISLSPSQLQSYFKDNHILWAAIQFIIVESDLMVECVWVKAHDNNAPNPHNDKADKLAKEGNTEDVFEFSTKSLPVNYHVLSWSGISIDTKMRDFTKHIVQAKNFNNIFNSNRQQKLKQLTKSDEIDWELTRDLIAVSSDEGSTSFANSGKKAFQIKCFTEELSTLQKLQRQRPDLYSSEWRCSTCGNAIETYEHVWLCSERRVEVTSCIEIVQHNLVTAVNSLLPQPLTNNQVVKLSSAPAWSLIPDQDHFTFIETTKGVVHNSFVNLLTEFGLGLNQASSIIISTLSGLVDLLQKVVWRARCDDQIQAERLHGIDYRSKLRRPLRTTSASTSTLISESVRWRPTRSASLRSSKVPNEEWFVWVNDVCHYGGTFLNYVIHS